MTEPRESNEPLPSQVLLAVEHAIEQLDARQKAEKAEEKSKNEHKDRLTSRVSIAAICLTMLMSFLNFARTERDSSSSDLKSQASRAGADAEANWAYYQTRVSERSSFNVADDSLRRDVEQLPDGDPRVRLAGAFHADYSARVASIDLENRQVFWVVQDLRKRQILLSRAAARIDRQIARYDMGTRVLTLAVVLLSVTLLANRGFLFWIASGIAAFGAAIAVNGYFLFF